MSKPSVFERDQGRCRYCGDVAFGIDHVIPRSRWKAIMALDSNIGLSDDANCVAACKECNNHKGDLLLHEVGMVFLPAGTHMEPGDAQHIRDQIGIKPRFPAKPRQSARVLGGPATIPRLSQPIGSDKRWRELLASAQEALENEHGLHAGYRPA